MKKNQNFTKKKLDHEEKELLASFENDEWTTVRNVKKEKELACETAAKTLRKDMHTFR